MSDLHRLLEDVSYLLGALAGVSVLDRHVRDSQAIFHIDIRNEVAAYQLQRLCTAANVELIPAFRSKEHQGLQVDDIRRFSIRANFRSFDFIDFDFLSPDAANTRLRRWRASEGVLAEAVGREVALLKKRELSRALHDCVRQRLCRSARGRRSSVIGPRVLSITGNQ